MPGDEVITAAAAILERRGVPIALECGAHGLQASCGSYRAVVEPDGDQYRFVIRDKDRSDPAIHGYGMERRRAVTALADLLEGLGG